jgi:GNAT superfamily N-acetyltransferase
MQSTSGIKFQRENLASIQHEIKPLLEEHWEEVAVNKDKIKLNPNWEVYAYLETAGSLGIYTARKDKELVGYFVVIAEAHIHYKDHIFASNDVVYLAPAYRKGMVGANLIQYAEQDLKKLGVSVLTINTKVHRPFDSLMERMGFSLKERVYSKYLGE